jgi:hypothetical protein
MSLCLITYVADLVQFEASNEVRLAVYFSLVQFQASNEVKHALSSYINAIIVYMKPLYRQNSHYIGKSMASRLAYRLITKSVPCRLENMGLNVKKVVHNVLTFYRFNNHGSKTTGQQINHTP